MNILNLHGFRGDYHNAAYGALTELGHEVISPMTDYENESPDEVLDKLGKIIKDNGCELLAGTSLGGFYAAVLSAETGLPAVLVNPCLMPFYHLPAFDGYRGEFTPYIRLFGKLEKLDSKIVNCIIGGQDEVIDTHSFDVTLLGEDRITVIPEGMHSGATLPLKDYFKSLLK